jgi:hypothetical protein
MNTASSRGESDYGWQVVVPESATGGFLAELSEFRGRVLYAGGRRPSFAREGGRFADDDPLDLASFHVTVRADGGLIGCVRVTPLLEYSMSIIGRGVGPSCLEAAVNRMNLARTDCVEAGRWIVAPSARGALLGRTLLLSLWVTGQWLDKRCLFGAVGVRDGQSRVVSRCGGRAAPGMDRVFVKEYDDELSVMYFDLDHPPPEVAVELTRVRCLLHMEHVASGTAAARAV